MTTPADIVNRALQLVGGYDNNKPITGTPPNFNNSAYGLAAGAVYTSVVQTIGRQFGWDFSRNVGVLVPTGGTAPLGFAHEYAYPSNGIQVRQVVPATIDPNNPVPIEWVVGSAVGNTTAATGFIDFPNNPNNNDTITLNGAVFTFVTSGATPTNFQINIGGNLGGTLALLVNALPPGGYNNIPQLTVASYAASSPRLVITYNTLGVEGNSYTLAASAATVSGPTLSGGGSAARRVIWTNEASAQCTFSGQPPEDAWDAGFTEAVVQMLAGKLALAIPSKPESAALAQQGALQTEGMAEKRFDT